MANSSIEWTQMTWNPTTGCTKVSAGCRNCYAEAFSKRLKAMGQEKYSQGFELNLHSKTLQIPFTWKSPQMVFVNSMSDLFHEDVPFEFIREVFKVMNDNPQHVFQVLTKRAERLHQIHKDLTWTENIWMGVSVEDNSSLYRLDYLRKIKAKMKFVSFEPLLEGLNKVNLCKINWVIVGGESGKGARPLKEEWVISILALCQPLKIPFFFKQWGGFNKKSNGRLLNGRIYNEFPRF
jgi:protein gp37